jgi:hypothetical protein
VLALCRGLRLEPEELLEGLVRERRSLVVGVAETLSTNHTAFFREPEAFDMLRNIILPTLPVDGPLRIWSAAASSGEEAYSIAFALRDELGPSALQRVRILGTDLSQRQIHAAERAHYPRFLLPHDEALAARRDRDEPRDEVVGGIVERGGRSGRAVREPRVDGDGARRVVEPEGEAALAERVFDRADRGVAGRLDQVARDVDLEGPGGGHGGRPAHRASTRTALGAALGT